MPTYPVYIEGKWYLYSTIVNDYLGGPYDNPEDVASAFTENEGSSFHSAEDSFCLRLKNFIDDSGEKVTRGQLITMYRDPCPTSEDLKLTNEEFDGWLYAVAYRSALEEKARAKVDPKAWYDDVTVEPKPGVVYGSPGRSSKKR